MEQLVINLHSQFFILFFFFFLILSKKMEVVNIGSFGLLTFYPDDNKCFAINRVKFGLCFRWERRSIEQPSLTCSEWVIDFVLLLLKTRGRTLVELKRREWGASQILPPICRFAEKKEWAKEEMCRFPSKSYLPTPQIWMPEKGCSLGSTTPVFLLIER